MVVVITQSWIEFLSATVIAQEIDPHPQEQGIHFGVGPFEQFGVVVFGARVS
jgi:hypothetical protein